MFECLYIRTFRIVRAMSRYVDIDIGEPEDWRKVYEDWKRGLK